MAWIWPGCATGPDLSVHGSGRAVYSQHHYVYLSWQTYRVHIYHAIHLVYSYLSILPSLHRTAEKNRATFPPCTAHASNARGSSMRLVTLRYVPHTEAPPLSTRPVTLMSQLTRERNLEPLSPLVNSSLFPPFQIPLGGNITDGAEMGTGDMLICMYTSPVVIFVHGRSVGNMQGNFEQRKRGEGVGRK